MKSKIRSPLIRATRRKRKTKECLGCGDSFLTFQNYDYCPDCALNGCRYLNKKSSCPECDGSGIIQFPKSKPRPCKLCYLKQENMKLTKTEKYWEQVDLLAQEKIYQLLTKNIPFQNIKLITEPWKFEDKQMKLSGLFLDRDVDYRTLLSEIEDQSSEATSDKEYLAEEIAVWYLRMVIKSLLGNLSDYSGYDPSLFENLT
jgi:hypothetical protein